jgi:3-oxoacyl-[acyl-carrier-protein] synthase-3
MRWSDIHLRASAMVLGRREDTAAAVADGRYDADLHTAHGYRSVCVAGGRLPVDMAVDAARIALARSGVDPAQIRLVVHVSSTRQGPDELVPASYVQGRALLGTACALSIDQTCNGAIAALELASAYLTAAPAGWSALLTTADQHGPETERYSSDPGSVGADGATGLVLSRGTGPARLLSTAVLGDGRFADVGVVFDGLSEADQRAARAEHRKRLLPMLESMAALQRETIGLALSDAGLDRTEVTWWLFPHVGANMVDRELRKEFGIEDEQTAWEWARTVGHLGTGNQIAGLTHLVEDGAIRVGDRVALCGNGQGFSYGCAILELVAAPDWSSGARH